MRKRRPLTDNCDTSHTDEFKRKLVNRLNRLEGQIRGIKRMIIQDQYCIDILNQMMAVESALSASSKVLMEEHIKSCIGPQLEKENKAIVNELLLIMKNIQKK